jgi:DNA-directed RNA polymerase specialized sigma24 family protein
MLSMIVYQAEASRGEVVGSNKQSFFEPYLSDLHKHCLRLTGSTWDAEELTQETLLKAQIALEKHPDRPISKSFLYRIATNLWIDSVPEK